MYTLGIIEKQRDTHEIVSHNVNFTGNSMFWLNFCSVSQENVHLRKVFTKIFHNFGKTYAYIRKMYKKMHKLYAYNQSSNALKSIGTKSGPEKGMLITGICL